jgi:hypothetical protein
MVSFMTVIHAETAHSTPWTGGWVSPRACVDAILPLPGTTILIKLSHDFQVPQNSKSLPGNLNSLHCESIRPVYLNTIHTLCFGRLNTAAGIQF